MTEANDGPTDYGDRPAEQAPTEYRPLLAGDQKPGSVELVTKCFTAPEGGAFLAMHPGLEATVSITFLAVPAGDE